MNSTTMEIRGYWNAKPDSVQQNKMLTRQGDFVVDSAIYASDKGVWVLKNPRRVEGDMQRFESSS